MKGYIAPEADRADYRKKKQGAASKAQTRIRHFPAVTHRCTTPAVHG